MTARPFIVGTPPAAPSPAEIAGALRGFYIRSHNGLERRLLPHGLSVARLRVLECIGAATQCRSIDIVDLLPTGSRSITPLVDGLERDGLVVREPDKTDRRAKWLSLTSAGRGRLADGLKARDDFVEILFKRLDQIERGAPLDLLGQLSFEDT